MQQRPAANEPESQPNYSPYRPGRGVGVEPEWAPYIQSSLPPTAGSDPADPVSLVSCCSWPRQDFLVLHASADPPSPTPPINCNHTHLGYRPTPQYSFSCAEGAGCLHNHSASAEGIGPASAGIRRWEVGCPLRGMVPVGCLAAQQTAVWYHGGSGNSWTNRRATVGWKRHRWSEFAGAGLVGRIDLVSSGRG